MVRTLDATKTGGVAESGMYPAYIETARIMNVNIEDWSVDIATSIDNKLIHDLQVNAAYLHFFGGEGSYVMPEVGALCWIAWPSSGKMAMPFVLGFKTESNDDVDPETGETQGGYRSNRPVLVPGDMMMRTRDENFLILRRGGVVQIGSTPICQRMFIPIGNIIRDICQSYSLDSFAGGFDFITNRTDQSDAGDVTTAFQIRSKTRANEPKNAGVLRMGSHDDDANLRLSLVVFESGENDAPTVVQMTMDKLGNVRWAMEKTWVIKAKGDIQLTSAEGSVLVEALKGPMSFMSKNDMGFESTTGKIAMKSKGAWSASGSKIDLKGKDGISLRGRTQVGGPGGEPMVKGKALLLLLTELVQGLVDASNPLGPATSPPGWPVLLPAAAKLLPKIQQILSTDNTTT